MGVETFMADHERFKAKGEYNMCQAMDALKIPEEDREKYLQRLEQ